MGAPHTSATARADRSNCGSAAISRRMGIPCIARRRPLGGELPDMGRAAAGPRWGGRGGTSARGCPDMGCASRAGCAERRSDVGFARGRATIGCSACAFVGRAGRCAASRGRSASALVGSAGCARPLVGSACGGAFGRRTGGRDSNRTVMESACVAHVGPFSGCRCGSRRASSNHGRSGSRPCSRRLGRAAGCGLAGDRRTIVGPCGDAVQLRAFLEPTSRAGLGHPED